MRLGCTAQDLTFRRHTGEIYLALMPRLLIACIVSVCMCVLDVSVHVCNEYQQMVMSIVLIQDLQGTHNMSTLWQISVQTVALYAQLGL